MVYFFFLKPFDWNFEANNFRSETFLNRFTSPSTFELLRTSYWIVYWRRLFICGKSDIWTIGNSFEAEEEIAKIDASVKFNPSWWRRNLVSYKFYLLDVQNFRVAISEHFQLVFRFVSNLFAILKDFKLKRRSLANFRMDLSKFDTDVQHFCFFYAIPCVSTLFKINSCLFFAEPGEEIWGNCEKFFFRGCFALFILLFLLPSGSTIRFQFSHLWIFSNFSAIFVLFLGELGMINWLNNSFSLLCNISCSRELTPTTMQHIALIYREEFYSKFNFNRTQFRRK